jgi:hypothetical protein
MPKTKTMTMYKIQEIKRSLETQSPEEGSNRNFLCQPTAFTPVSCLVYCSALKMEATCFSETSIEFQRLYIPGDRTLPKFFFFGNFIISSLPFHHNKSIQNGTHCSSIDF